MLSKTKTFKSFLKGTDIAVVGDIDIYPGGGGKMYSDQQVSLYAPNGERLFLRDQNIRALGEHLLALADKMDAFKEKYTDA